MYNSRPDIGSTYRGRVLVANKLSHNEALAVKMDKSLHKKIEHKEAFGAKYQRGSSRSPAKRRSFCRLVVSGVMLPCLRGDRNHVRKVHRGNRKEVRGQDVLGFLLDDFDRG